MAENVNDRCCCWCYLRFVVVAANLMVFDLFLLLLQLISVTVTHRSLTEWLKTTVLNKLSSK